MILKMEDSLIIVSWYLNSPQTKCVVAKFIWSNIIFLIKKKYTITITDKQMYY